MSRKSSKPGVTYKVTFKSGIVANVKIHTTLKGRAFVGVLKNATSVLEDKLRKHNSIPEGDEIVSIVATSTPARESDCIEFTPLAGCSA